MADELLAAAIANWEPRFTVNGVDASDFARITSNLSRWDDWCAAWSLCAHSYEQLAQAASDEGRLISAGELFARAATYYHFAKFLFVHDLEQAKRAHEFAVDALKRGAPLLVPPGRRVEIPFEDSTLVGLFRAPATPGPHPTVLLIAGLDSAKEEFREVEASFLSRGMATFALDGPGQGEAEWTLAIRPEWDAVGRAVLDHVCAMDGVDASRVGVWGVSLGGYYAARVAAADARVRATVVLCGPYDFSGAWSNLNPLTRHAFEVRSFSSSPEDAQRRSRDFTLDGFADQISAPLLVVAGKRDRLFSWHDAQRLAEEARGDTTLLVLEDGNHGCANVIHHHRPLSADWMARRLQLEDD